ncbi:MAG: translation initiation factor [Flavobacteriales bacterium]|jgi:translation initiation factor 1|nr:translation initiation factor [Flavobacteriales bacterium]
MGKNKKNRKDVVYSTNPNFDYEYDEDSELNTLTPSEQHLTSLIDRKLRKGKPVTLITGFIGSESDLKELGKLLKIKCGVGGSVKNGEVILQGDVRDKVVSMLKSLDYNVKKSG